MDFEKILSIPKSLWISSRFFPLKEAIKLPILVRYNTKVFSTSGSIKVKEGILKTSLLRIGFGKVGIYDKKYSRTIIDIRGTIHLNGDVTLGHGSSLCVEEGASLTFGKNYSNTAEGKIVCRKKITFGDNVTTSWETLIMDTDWHFTQNTLTQEIYPDTKEITIGDNVWICTRSVILKGSFIPNGCIIGANSLCTKPFQVENTVIAGNPAKVRKENITMIQSSE